MKPIYKQIILWVLTLLHIALIFSFSLQSAAESAVISKGVTEKIKSRESFEQQVVIEKESEGKEISKGATKVLARQKFHELERVVRKIAHASLFFVLGLLINLLIRAYGANIIFCGFVSLIFAAAVGFADESIQLFTVGRAGLLSDVFIDVCGAIVSSVFFVTGGKVYEKNKNRRYSMDS